MFDHNFQRVIYMYPEEDQSEMRIKFCEKLRLYCEDIEIQGGLCDFSGKIILFKTFLSVLHIYFIFRLAN